MIHRFHAQVELLQPQFWTLKMEHLRTQTYTLRHQFGVSSLSICQKSDVTCRFSHPVGTLATSALDINDGQGVIEALNNTGADGDLCGGFTIRARVPFSPWDTLQTTVGVTVKGAEVTDVYGIAFPTYTNTSTLDHRSV